MCRVIHFPDDRLTSYVICTKKYVVVVIVVVVVVVVAIFSAIFVAVVTHSRHIYAICSNTNMFAETKINVGQMVSAYSQGAGLYLWRDNYCCLLPAIL